MPAYQYIAIDQKGKRKKGILEGENARLVRSQLRSQHLTPIEVNPVKEAKNISSKEGSFLNRFQRLSMKAADLALITRQMATLLDAGIPLDEVLSSVAEQSEKPQVKSILLGVRAKVLEGHRLAQGMDAFPRAFPKLYRTTVLSGEQSGNLDKVLDRLADYTEKQHRMKQKIRQALVYPSLMIGVSIFVVVFLLIYVVPKIIDVFNQTNQALPMPTIILLGISHFISHYGIYMLGIIILGVIGFRYGLRNEGFKAKVHSVLLKLPVLGKAFRVINCARFARTLGILNAATVPILDGMQTAAQLITPIPMRNAVDAAVNKVREGTPINYALQQTGYFPPMFIHLIASGEASGKLDQMLIRAADNQESDVEALIESVLTLFEPVMILVMGSVVLFIVMAIMLPIFSLDQFNG